MAMTFGSIAKVATTAALAGAQAQSGLNKNLMNSPMTKEEGQALAIGKVAEANIIEPKEKKSGSGLMIRNQEKTGLSLQTYNQLGKMGEMTAMKRAGSSQPKLLSQKI